MKSYIYIYIYMDPQKVSLPHKKAKNNDEYKFMM
jgi:hypothetical protein